MFDPNGNCDWIVDTVTKDRAMPNPVRVSDVAEFLGAPERVVRLFLSHIYPADPVPSAQDRLMPIEAQALAATLKGKENGEEKENEESLHAGADKG